MKLSVAIQTHPLRAEMAAALRAQLPGSQLAVDPDPEHALPSPWRTYRHALETTPDKATHRLVIQDDATLCRGFLAAARRAVAARPLRPVVFWIGGAPADYALAVRQHAAADVPWVRLSGDRWLPVIAVSWPVTFIQPILDFVDSQNWPPEFRADDEILGRALRHLGEYALATAPSLVQHSDVTPSLIGRRAWAGRDPDRVAACWIGDCDPAGIDWDHGPE